MLYMIYETITSIRPCCFFELSLIRRELDKCCKNKSQYTHWGEGEGFSYGSSLLISMKPVKKKKTPIKVVGYDKSEGEEMIIARDEKGNSVFELDLSKWAIGFLNGRAHNAEIAGPIPIAEKRVDDIIAEEASSTSILDEGSDCSSESSVEYDSLELHLYRNGNSNSSGPYWTHWFWF